MPQEEKKNDESLMNDRCATELRNVPLIGKTEVQFIVLGDYKDIGDLKKVPGFRSYKFNYELLYFTQNMVHECRHTQIVVLLDTLNCATNLMERALLFKAATGMSSSILVVRGLTEKGLSILAEKSDNWREEDGSYFLRSHRGGQDTPFFPLTKEEILDAAHFAGFDSVVNKRGDDPEGMFVTLAFNIKERN